MSSPKPSGNCDIRQRCARAGQPCSSSDHHQYSFTEAIGESPTIISDRFTLSMAEHNLRCSEIKRHKRAGVTFRDAQYGTFLSAGLEIGRDTVIGVGVQIYGSTVVGRCVSALAVFVSSSNHAPG